MDDELKHGDEVAFGETRFRVEIEGRLTKLVPITDPHWLLKVCHEAMSTRVPDPKLMKMLNKKARPR